MSHEHYEERDASPRFAIGLIAGLFLIIALVLIGTGVVLPIVFDDRDAPLENAVTPPAPRLQVAPADQWQTLKATQEAQLHSYGWIDRENAVAHIPIERAMGWIVTNGWNEPEATEESR